MSDHEETPKDESNPPAAEETDAPAGDEEVAKSETEKEPSSEEKADEKESPDDETKEENKENGSSKPEVELTPEEWKAKAKQLEGMVEKMKEFVFRTDISATDKVNQVKNLLVPEEEKPKPAPQVHKKRAAVDEDGAPKPKIKKTGGEGDDGEVNSDDEDRDIDSCVVCGLYLQVFKDDKDKELQHYLSHGFNILKEFEILKPDDTLFLCCNICSSIYPRKCHVNYRKHLVSDHTDRIVEIFREI
eukprot:TRINITY_DN46943_c0_g1_i1.p1 TRINITY_DN46943_c0_g1~~TRINITY_DN46943_c0_g1_i1.p1  ORF type:complete len:245 (+),score=112.23 TRINITY_DN46943_c0_g1_i1:51-785(+)